MNMLKSTLKLSLLLLVAFALPVYAQGSVQGVLDSYLNALGPPKFVCGVGLRHSNFKNQPSQLETDTLAKIHQYGDSAIPTLVQNLSNPANHDSRLASICESALGQLGPAATSALVSMLQNSQGNLSIPCVQSASRLIRFADPTIRRKALVDLLNTTGSSQPTCWFAVDEITRISGSRNLDDPGDLDANLLARYALHFAAGLSSNSEDMRRSSARLLKHCTPAVRDKQMASKVALALAKYLETRISQKSNGFDTSVVEAISYFPSAPPSEVINTLVRCSNAQDKFVAESSVGALVFLASRFEDVPLKGLFSLLSGDESKRVLVINRLRLLSKRQDEAVPYLIQIGSNPSERNSKVLVQTCMTLRSYDKEASAAVPMLAKLLAHSDIQVQKSACEALSNIGREARQAIPALYNLCSTTKDQRLYADAARAIKRISR